MKCFNPKIFQRSGAEFFFSVSFHKSTYFLLSYFGRKRVQISFSAKTCLGVDFLKKFYFLAILFL